ncbi:MAG: response regulator transcription factor [Actinomycetota bacterium]
MTSDDQPSVLIVEDDRGVRESLAVVLEHQGLSVLQAATGEEGVELVRRGRPGMIVLDLNLPGIDGIEVCRRIRIVDPHVGILMLTARDSVPERVRGLDAGADDYLPKPFALEELLARIRRRIGGTSGRLSPHVVRVEDLHLDQSGRRAWRGDRELALTKREFDLLELLAENAGRVLTRSEIEHAVWGHDGSFGSNSLEVFVSSLRRKTEVGGGARLLQTVRGVGYVLRGGTALDAAVPV